MTVKRTICWTFVMAWLGLAAPPVSANSNGNCFQVAKGTALYSDVLGQTVVGEVTAPTIGWFGDRTGTDPTLSLHFISLNEQQKVTELVARVRLEDSASIACPTADLRPANSDLTDLTWPGGGWAGSIVEEKAVFARRDGKRTGERSCFAADVPNVAAIACVLTHQRTRPSCVALAAGKPVFVHADPSTRIGETTERVVTLLHYGIGDFVVTDLGIVRRRDTRPARCLPEPKGEGGILGLLDGGEEAMLPNGRDAGIRVSNISAWTTPEEIVVAGKILQCFEFGDVVRMKVCTHIVPQSNGFRELPSAIVAFGDPVVTGRLTKAIIRRYVKRHLERIRFCYEKQLLADPRFAGTAQATFTIDRKGRVARASASGLNNVDAETCLVSALQDIQFPKPSAGEVVVRYPITFVRKNTRH